MGTDAGGDADAVTVGVSERSSGGAVLRLEGASGTIEAANKRAILPSTDELSSDRPWIRRHPPQELLSPFVRMSDTVDAKLAKNSSPVSVKSLPETAPCNC